MRDETLEQRVDGAGPGELFAKQPDGLGVGNGVMQFEPEKTHEGEAVADLKLGLVVGERVERLEDQNFEHQHGVIGRATALHAIRALQRRPESGPENLEIDRFLQPRQRIADFRELLVTLVLTCPYEVPPRRIRLRLFEGRADVACTLYGRIDCSSMPQTPDKTRYS